MRLGSRATSRFLMSFSLFFLPLEVPVDGGVWWSWTVKWTVYPNDAGASSEPANSSYRHQWSTGVLILCPLLIKCHLGAEERGGSRQRILTSFRAHEVETTSLVVFLNLLTSCVYHNGIHTTVLILANRWLYNLADVISF